jgi:hypothetical protein
MIGSVSVAMVAATCGVSLGVIGTAAYLRGIRAGTTTPHRGSWLVWSVIALVAAVSHGADGGRWSLLVLAAQAAGTVLIFVWAIRRGMGGVTSANAALLTVALLGILGWLTLDDPIAATACAALADGAGLVAIVPKIWREPDSETCATYALAGAGGLLTVLAVPSMEASLLLFPTYYCVGNTAVAHLILWRRRGIRWGSGGEPPLRGALPRRLALAVGVGQPTPGVLEVRPDEPLEELELLHLTDHHVLGDEVEIVEALDHLPVVLHHPAVDVVQGAQVRAGLGSSNCVVLPAACLYQRAGGADG